MGIWDFLNSNTVTETVKRHTPDITPVTRACRTSMDYGSAAVTKIDNLVRVNGQHMIGRLITDDETRSKIGVFATKFTKNAGVYALDEGYKLVPGGVAISNIISETMKELEHESDKPKPVEGILNAPGKELMARAEIQPRSRDRVNIASQKPEDVIRVFMMKEFVGTRILDDLMVPKTTRGKNTK